MKANEFFKAMGINAVRQFLENDNIRTKEMHDDLKRLVESHELVKSRGGLDAAKHELILLQKHLKNTFGYVTIITSEKIENLKQAIADVESCMEVSSESN